MRMPVKDIDSFVQEKRDWIQKHLSLHETLPPPKETLAFGDAVPFLGQPYTITPVPGGRAYVRGNCFCLPETLQPELIREVCIRLYKTLGQSVLRQKAADRAAAMGVHITSVSVNSAKTRWGSCSAQGRLNFSYRLLCAPDDVIDYVVVHELAHRKEMNHSPAFWSIVAAHIPDWKTKRAALKGLQGELNHLGL
jgi:predicted metal-dependent hydrolase